MRGKPVQRLRKSGTCGRLIVVTESEYVDANVLLRLVRRDDVEQREQSERYLRAALGRGIELRVAAPTVSEFVYVLSGPAMGHSREEVATAVGNLLQLPFLIADEDVLARALILYRDHHPDWDDCMVSAYALEKAAGRLLSFDRGLDRIP